MCRSVVDRGGGGRQALEAMRLSPRPQARGAKWGAGVVFLFPAVYAVRSSLALLVVENILAFLFAVFLGVCLLRGPTSSAAAAAAAGEHGLHGAALAGALRGSLLYSAAGRPHLESGLLSPSWHRTAAVCVCWVVLLCSAVSSCLTSCIAEYQSWIDAELLLQGMHGLVEEESAQHLPASGDPLLLPSSSGSRSSKATVAVPFMSYGSESYEALEESRHLRGLCAGIV
ncbi:hypothetical protein Esti_004861 [Eimeria stiedai]